MSSFNALLLHISDQLTADQLYKVKYLYMDVLGKREAEKIFQGIQLFQCLVERGELSQHNTDLLSQRLKQIQRQDLSDKLDNFRTSDSTSSQPSQEEIVQVALLLLLSARSPSPHRHLGPGSSLPCLSVGPSASPLHSQTGHRRRCDCGESGTELA
ncbi:protein FADD isoform X2 [Nerophis ophidion]|uniref:protein FADD isoform X2 n=1 Tax=Nerophis ophidion TaxID=159077 RepID=UPI002AE0A372|nr:protein FADD isoform X2 [Nerophis ophidion]